MAQDLKYREAFGQRAENIRYRVRLSYEEKNRRRKEGPQVYDNFLGLYSNSETAEFSGIESKLSDLVGELLRRDLESSSSDPVVVLDFGGGLGFSFGRLAGRYKKEIKESRLVLVVTNLDADKDKIFGEFKKIKSQNSTVRIPGDVYAKILEEHESNMHLLNFLEASAGELRRATISLPNGIKLALAGRVDVVHEKLALAHSLKPEIDVPLLGSMLSERGILFLGSRRPTTRMKFGGGKPQAFKMGLDNLIKLGLVKDDSEEVELACPGYRVFSKPDSSLK